MALVSEFDRQGNWLFRWRSYLPFALLVPLLAAFRTFDDPNHDPNLQQWWTIVCMGVSLAGLALRAIAVGSAAPNTSGRNTHGQVADAVNTTGIYSVVRHPLYLGNYLMWLGITMYCHNGWLVAVFTLMFFLYYERIMMAEENYLSGKFGAAFTEWAARTPAFIPRWSQWQPPARPISWKKVLRQEYTGLFGVTTAFFLLDVARHMVLERRVDADPLWGVVFVAGLCVYLALRTAKRHTPWLAT